MGPDISAQSERILDALADNLHRLFFLDHHGLSESEREAAAAKAVKIAVDQVGAAGVDTMVGGLHPQLRAKVAALREQNPEAFA